MNVRWTARAERGLREIIAFIWADRPSAAEHILDRILGAARALGEHPNLGRPGRARGTRELVVASTPYLLVYRVRRNVVQILTVYDGRRRSTPCR